MPLLQGDLQTQTTSLKTHKKPTLGLIKILFDVKANHLHGNRLNQCYQQVHTRFHHQIDEIWGTGQNSVKYFPIRKNQWCCDGTKPNTSFMLWRPRPKNNKRLIHGTHEMVAENFEKTPGYFLPSSSLGFYSNVQPVPEKFLEENTKPQALSSGIYWGNQIPFPFKKMSWDKLCKKHLFDVMNSSVRGNAFICE